MADTGTSRAALSANNFGRLILILAAVVWLGVGVSGLVNPTELADWFGIDLESKSALAEFRAMYGGLSIALALLHGGAAVRGAWLRPALLMSSTITAGLLFGRVVSVAMDGMFGPVVMALAGIEVVLLGLSGIALWRLWRGPVADTAPKAVAAAGPLAPDPAAAPLEQGD